MKTRHTDAMRRTRGRRLLAVAASFGLALTACGGADPGSEGAPGSETADPAAASETGDQTETQAAPEPASIDFGLPTIMGPNNSPMAVAEGMGYFAEEGLDVNIINTGGSVDTVQATISGQIDIGSATPEPIMQAVVDEAGGDLVMIYNYLRAPTGSIAVPADSEIESLEDFRGATIGASSLGSGNILLTNGILNKAGVGEDEIEYLAVGVGGQALQALQSGQVDGLALWDTEYAAMEAQGLALRTFSHPDAQQLFSTTYFATPDYVEENADVIARFGRAMAKASLFTATNPEAALQIMYELHSDTRIAGQSLEEQLEQDLIGLERRNQLLIAGDPSATGSWGAYDPDAVAEWVDFASGAEIIAEAVDPESLYDNSMVPAYNDWDFASVVEAAETWEP